MLNIFLYGNSIYFSHKMRLVYVGVSLGHLRIIIDLNGFDALLVTIDERFQFFYFNDTIDLLGGKLAQSIFGGLSYLGFRHTKFMSVSGEILLSNFGFDGRRINAKMFFLSMSVEWLQIRVFSHGNNKINDVLYYNYKMKQNEIRTDKRMNNFITTLPKANQIFDLSQEAKKSIYPFEMKCRRNNIINWQQQPYDNNQKSYKFIPPKQSVLEHFNQNYILYDKFNNIKDDQLFNANIYSIEKLKNLKNIDYVTNVEYTKPLSNHKNSLQFDSRFQSGNLSVVSFVDGIYCLLLHNDVNTYGYTNWFYFSVKNQSPGNYKFAIMNYGKAGWPFNNGVKICVFQKETGWTRKGNNINCQHNQKLYQKKHKYSAFSTLYFQYQFQKETQVYFAYNIPYTYTDLQCYLTSIQNQNFPYFHRKLAGLSMCGNRLQYLTITNFQTLKNVNDLPVIVILARAHAGQTVSSWLLHNFLQFLLSNQSQAIALRENFIFKIFPMLNPDGVIHGNYRCSLSGRDLNRRWLEASKDLFPQVYYVKNQIIQISCNRQIKMLLDLHGHSQMRKVFAYGCHDRFQPHKCRLFPYMVSKLTQNFQFKSCNFYIDKSKLSTARVTMYKYLKIHHVFTIQSSQFGTNEGHHSNKVFRDVAKGIGLSMLMLFHIKVPSKKLTDLQSQKIQFQLANDISLIKVGIEKDAGSDSQPSIDNIKYDKLAKMNNRKAMKINSNIVEINKICRSTPKNIFKGVFEKKKMTQSVKLTAVNKNLKTSRDFHMSNCAFNEPRIIKTADCKRTYRKLQQEPKVVRKYYSSKMQQKETVKLINFSLSISEAKPKNRPETTSFQWRMNSSVFGGKPRIIKRNHSQVGQK